MLPPKLAALYEEMEKVRGETLAALSGLDEREFQQSGGGGWSAGQILAHERDHQLQIRELVSRLWSLR